MGRLVPREYFDFTGGVNLRDAPVGLAVDELLASENMEPAQGAPWLQGRGGQSAYNATAIDANAIRSLYRFYKQNGTGILVATSGTKIYKGDDGAGTFADISDAAFTSDKKWTFTTWSVKDKMYGINGFEGLRSWDGVAATTAVVGGSPPVGAFVEFHDDRLWILQDNALPFSDLNTDNSWPAANSLNLSDKRGGRAKFLKSYSEVLIAGKETGLWRFQGSPLFGGQLKQYSEIPCIAAYSADVTPFGVPFLGPDGVYVTDGFDVTLISGKITPLFTSYFRTAVGKYYAKKKQYWLSFSTTGAAADQLWVGTRIEINGQARIAWHKYTGFNVESMATWDGGSDTGQIYLGLSNTGKVRRADTGAQDVGSNYTCRFQLRNEDFGGAGVSKRLRWLKAVFEASQTLGYAVDYSFGRRASAGSLGVPGQSGVLSWDVGNWDEKNWSGTVVSNQRTSILDRQHGEFLSIAFQNNVDGPNFKFYGVEADARPRDERSYEPFSLYTAG